MPIALFFLRHHRTLIQLSFTGSFGFVVLAGLFFEALRRARTIGLFLMLWILIPLPIVYYTHLPMKYLLPCMPAVILLCFRLMEVFSIQVARAAAVVLIVAEHRLFPSDPSLGRRVCGLLAGTALYRLIGPHVAAGERVWFGSGSTGHIGMRRWLERHLRSLAALSQGPEICWWWSVRRAGEPFAPERFPHRTLVETISHKYRFGRTMGAGIGLYTNGLVSGCGGLVRVTDRFELWRID